MGKPRKRVHDNPSQLTCLHRPVYFSPASPTCFHVLFRYFTQIFIPVAIILLFSYYHNSSSWFGHAQTLYFQIIWFYHNSQCLFGHTQAFSYQIIWFYHIMLDGPHPAIVFANHRLLPQFTIMLDLPCPCIVFSNHIGMALYMRLPHL